MPTPESPPCQTDTEQRAALRRLGVIEAQIAELEVVLPVCRALLALLGNPARLQDVRDEFQLLAKTMESAEDSMSRLSKAGPSQPALHEVMTRLQVASYEAGGDLQELSRTLEALTLARDLVRRAHASLPNEERRRRVASPLPVKMIDDALLAGWGKAYVRVGEGEPDASSPVVPMPPYPFKPSTGHNSLFRQLVRICYDVVRATHDSDTSDPERAVKAYVRGMKERDTQQRLEYLRGTLVDVLRAYLLKRRQLDGESGQQVP